MSWLQTKAPGLHKFLTRKDSPYPAVRELVGGALVIVVLLGGLWLYSGQSLGTAPVVVVESGSMMHCDNLVGASGDNCKTGNYGRVSTIDPGDLIIVKKVSEHHQIGTQAGKGENHYGKDGDVIIYRKGAGTPIIHRAQFWLEIHGPHDFSVPELGLSHISSLDDPAIVAYTGQRGWGYHIENDVNTCKSGFITRGDNNPASDQGSGITNCPVQMSQVIGKARGEIPWVGLIKLKVSDLSSGTHNFANAPGDTKVLLLVAIVVLVGAPIVIERLHNRKARREADAQAEPKKQPPAK